MIPFRMCCGQQHLGPVCPDGLVMCCQCFERFPVDQLAMVGLSRVDQCQSCADYEASRGDA